MRQLNPLVHTHCGYLRLQNEKYNCIQKQNKTKTEKFSQMPLLIGQLHSKINNALINNIRSLD